MCSRSKQRDLFGCPVHVAAITDGPSIAKRYRIVIGALSCILVGIRKQISNGIVSKLSNDTNVRQLIGFTPCMPTWGASVAREMQRGLVILGSDNFYKSEMSITSSRVRH